MRSDGLGNERAAAHPTAALGFALWVSVSLSAKVRRGCR